MTLLSVTAFVCVSIFSSPKIERVPCDHPDLEKVAIPGAYWIHLAFAIAGFFILAGIIFFQETGYRRKWVLPWMLLLVVVGGLFVISGCLLGSHLKPQFSPDFYDQCKPINMTNLCVEASARGLKRVKAQCNQTKWYMAQFRSAAFNRIAAAAAYYSTIFQYWVSWNKKKKSAEHYVALGAMYIVGAIGVLLNLGSWIDMAGGITAGIAIGALACFVFGKLYKNWEVAGDPLLPCFVNKICSCCPVHPD